MAPLSLSMLPQRGRRRNDGKEGRSAVTLALTAFRYNAATEIDNKNSPGCMLLPFPLQILSIVCVNFVLCLWQ